MLLVLPWQGIIKVFNAGARNLSGYSRADEVVGRNVGVFLLPDLATGETGEQLIRSAASLSSSGGVEGSTVEVRVATRVGHVRTCNMRVLAQQQEQQQSKGDNGEEPVYIISLDDVTALQARVEALRYASRNLVITWRLIYIL
jgi:PAS domain S-box-containing protein